MTTEQLSSDLAEAIGALARAQANLCAERLSYAAEDIDVAARRVLDALAALARDGHRSTMSASLATKMHMTGDVVDPRDVKMTG